MFCNQIARARISGNFAKARRDQESTGDPGKLMLLSLMPLVPQRLLLPLLLLALSLASATAATVSTAIIGAAPARSHYSRHCCT
jgi:hypothetical protein